MIKYVITALFSVSMLTAQTSAKVVQNEVKVGDLFEIGRPATNHYEYINFPSADVIVKKGGKANYRRVEGNQVIVTSIKEHKDGITKVTIKRADGSRFFGSHTFISADFKDAVEAGELVAE